MTRARIITLAVVVAFALFIGFMIYMNVSPAVSGETKRIPRKLIERNTVTEVDGRTVEVSPSP